MKTSIDTMPIGWREWVSLPDLHIQAMKAKIDTGARTSSLHAVDIESFRQNNTPWVQFEVHPDQRSVRNSVICRAPIIDERHVRSSNGKSELRVVIRTTLALGAHRWPIDITLTGRSDMGFRFLLGREATRNRCIIDPGKSFLCGRAVQSKQKKRKQTP